MEMVLKLTLVNLAKLTNYSNFAFIAIFQFYIFKMLKCQIQFLRKIFQQSIYIFKLSNILWVVIQSLFIVLEHTDIVHNTAKFL